MCSISIAGLQRVQWTPQHLVLVERVANRLLEGVGVPSTDYWQDGRIGVTRTVRRQCSDAERRRVVEKYLQT